MNVTSKVRRAVFLTASLLTGSKLQFEETFQTNSYGVFSLDCHLFESIVLPVCCTYFFGGPIYGIFKLCLHSILDAPSLCESIAINKNACCETMCKNMKYSEFEYTT